MLNQRAHAPCTSMFQSTGNSCKHTSGRSLLNLLYIKHSSDYNFSKRPLNLSYTVDSDLFLCHLFSYRLCFT